MKKFIRNVTKEKKISGRRSAGNPPGQKFEKRTPLPDRCPLYPSEVFDFHADSGARARDLMERIHINMAAKKRSTVRKEVKKTLLEQLKNKGADVALFMDQIEDYMAMWDLKEQLIEDIRKYGIRTPDGKDNTSAKQLPIVNRQMLALLKILRIDTEGVINGDEDEL